MEYTSRNENFRNKSRDNVSPVGSVILDLPPSCIEFVPAHPSCPWAIEEPCFVIGTYDLQKEEEENGESEETTSSVPKEQSRQGSLSLFKLEGDELIKIQSFPTPSAILDLHFYPHLEPTIFATTSSTGAISIYSISAQILPSKSYQYTIIPVITHQVFFEDIIITSFSWDENQQSERPRMVVTTNEGEVKLVWFKDRGFLEYEVLNGGKAVMKHGYEAWCAVFGNGGNVIFSGGDDSKLLMSTIAPTSDLDPPSYTTIFSCHNAGVTAILPLPITLSQSPILLTGSYDDYIRILSLPSPNSQSRRAKILAELDIGLGGGGVWKLKFLQDSSPKTILNQKKGEELNLKDEREVGFQVLACCMRVGAKILEVRRGKDGIWGIEVVAMVSVHESMCYASDVVPVRKEYEEEERVVVSTSFYDRLVFVWRFDPLVDLGKRSEEKLEGNSEFGKIEP